MPGVVKSVGGVDSDARFESDRGVKSYGGSSRIGDLITGGCKTDAGRTTTDVGPEKSENPEYGIPETGGPSCKRADMGAYSSRGEGLAGADTGQTLQTSGVFTKRVEIPSKMDR